MLVLESHIFFLLYLCLAPAVCWGLEKLVFSINDTKPALLLPYLLEQAMRGLIFQALL